MQEELDLLYRLIVDGAEQSSIPLFKIEKGGK